ncbi:hypothetical protein DFH06DRAFT_1065367 [Mycena polygramma]|nr:hypothetical protein DFH06DRAFT_1065367 [Mycena polygramma]
MSDASDSRHGVDPIDEAAAAKLWTIYVLEAEKYDKSLVESWRSDMQGMLIFAGLFSASLTAFLIESYKTLSLDSGDQMVVLLAQISQQLASGPNGTVAPITAPVSFSPSPTSLVCNALWFISLGLSLACALIATLLEQWARDFIHRADMRSAPLIRARVYSYLYYGAKRFNMHVVVDIIPLLLHASLLFFFAGLVAFLMPVNILIAAICAALLLLVTTAYSVLTLLPLRYLDCPYRTPLSGAFWWLLQYSKIIWTHWRAPAHRTATDPSPPQETMVEATIRKAREDSPARRERDYRALVWTVRSLADDLELEPLVEVLPDLLWGHDGRRHAYSDHIAGLVNHPEVQLCRRIDGLYASSIDEVLSPELNQRRRISCYKALWAIASLGRSVSSLRISSRESDLDLPTDFHQLRAYARPFMPPETDGYAISAQIMMKWSTFCALYPRLEEQCRYLLQCQSSGRHNPPLAPVTAFLHHLTAVCGFLIHANGVYFARPETALSQADIPELLQISRLLRDTAPHAILFDYLRKSVYLGKPPYQWDQTRATITVDGSVPFAAFQQMLERNLSSVNQEFDFAAPADFLWSDGIVAELYAFWKPAEPVTIPSAILHYLTHRNSHDVLFTVLRQSGITPHLWFCFRTTLSDVQSSSHELLTSIWVLAFSTEFEADGASPAAKAGVSLFETPGSLLIYTYALEAMYAAKLPSPSTVALLKTGILTFLSAKLAPTSDLHKVFEHQVFPADSAIPLPDGSELDEDTLAFVDARIREAKIHVLAEFLQCCASEVLPFNAVETLRRISYIVPCTAVHKTHQLLYARSVDSVFAEARSVELMTAIVWSKCLDVYAGIPADILGAEAFPWLDEPFARQILKDTLSDWLSALAWNPTSSDLLERLRAILRGLETCHPEW